MSVISDFESLRTLRRELHRHPEPAWEEYYTTARLVEAVNRIGVDELYVGPAAIEPTARGGVPDDPVTFDRARERARVAGADEELIETLEDGQTGLVAVLDRGDGPHVGLRVDIDALVREESTDSAHRPAAEGFRSEHEGLMHACGHDGHATIGIGVLEAIAASDFGGRLTVCFQPAEEEIGGGPAVAESGHFDDVDYLFAIHLGLGHPTGEIVAGFEGFLAVANLDVEFTGAGSHAGSHPEAGTNAVQALAAAIDGLYAIPRHSAGRTRINAGRVEGGSASNIIPETATIQGEVRGETTALREYMKERAGRVLEGAATSHGCDVTYDYGPEAPSGESDPALAAAVESAAESVTGVDSVLPSAEFGGSEDATYLMERVQNRGGLATYVGIGTDHPGGHHSATFDIDEESLRIGIEVLTNAILDVETNPPQSA